MNKPTWTAEDQSALDALKKKRQEFEAAIRKPIDDIAKMIHGYNMSEQELAAGLVDYADELHTALEPFLMPRPRDEEQIALEIGTISFNAAWPSPLVALNEAACKGLRDGIEFIYIYLKKDPS